MAEDLGEQPWEEGKKGLPGASTQSSTKLQDHPRGSILGLWLTGRALLHPFGCWSTLPEDGASWMVHEAPWAWCWPPLS
jgi:hypothetical protein